MTMLFISCLFDVYRGVGADHGGETWTHGRLHLTFLNLFHGLYILLVEIYIDLIHDN